MPLSDFRDTYAWREAIDLSPALVNLAEQLPASEEMGLSYQLRKAMVQLPAAIAYDLSEANSFSRKVHLTRLAAMLDIVDRVYPALDTAGARKSLERLVDRVAGPGFGEQVPGAAKVYMPGAVTHLRPEPGTDKVVPEPLEIKPDPVNHVAVAADEAAADHAAGAPEPQPGADPSNVQVVPDPSASQEVHVHPDSSQ